MTIAIPRNLMQIWIGPRPAPLEWMQSWKDLHPDWDYTLIDNAYVQGRTFRCQPQIDEYIRRSEYAGAADLIRYEILHERGGFMPGADAVCLQNTNELWTQARAYTVYENEFVRGAMVSPILACEPGNAFVDDLIKRLSATPVQSLDKPWRTTGNYFVATLIEALEPDITIFPSHTFIPRHFTGRTYAGDGKIYADQLFGDTTGGYAKPNWTGRWQALRGRVRSSLMRRKIKARR